MKRLFIFIFAICAYININAQISEVSLVVNAEGPNKTEAIDNALRSAIEQTYGMFVSANTTILNDEVVKDEITTVSTGNIQKYTEISSVLLPNGNTSVTLEAVVSLTKLVSYAKSKGSECEFAGSTFGANFRLYEMHQKNETIVIQNMVKQLDALRPIWDYEIEVSDPVLSDDRKTARVGITINLIVNNRTQQFADILKHTMKSLLMTEEQVAPMQQMGFKFEPIRFSMGWSYDTLDLLNQRVDDSRHYNDVMAMIPQYYLFHSLPLELIDLLLDCLFDFEITDNLGGICSISSLLNLSDHSHAFRCYQMYSDAHSLVFPVKLNVKKSSFAQHVLEYYHNQGPRMGSPYAFSIPTSIIYNIRGFSIKPIKKTLEHRKCYNHVEYIPPTE